MSAWPGARGARLSVYSTHRHPATSQPIYNNTHREAKYLLTNDKFDNAHDDLALEFAERSDELTKHKNWMIVDTLALARFKTGNTQGAITSAKKAIELCGGECWGPKGLQKALDRYEAGVATVKSTD